MDNIFAVFLWVQLGSLTDAAQDLGSSEQEVEAEGSSSARSGGWVLPEDSDAASIHDWNQSKSMKHFLALLSVGFNLAKSILYIKLKKQETCGRKPKLRLKFV